MGVDHTTRSQQASPTLNSGGMLISDETGPSYENDITGKLRRMTMRSIERHYFGVTPTVAAGVFQAALRSVQ